MAFRLAGRFSLLSRNLKNNCSAGRRFITSSTNGSSSKSTTVPFLLGATLGVGSVLGGLHIVNKFYKNVESIASISTQPLHAAKKLVEPEEQTFIMVKPDGVQRALIGDIIKRFEQKGFKLVAMKFVQPNKELLYKHYEDLKSRPFFPGLIKYMVSGPVVAMVWEGKGVVKTGRVMLGETDPAKSLPGTIRGDYCIQVGRNIIHGSDSIDSAKTEISLWFSNAELVDWKPELARWINEDN